MNTKNIPGFTAEASIYKTSDHYRMAKVFQQADGAVYPAVPCCEIHCDAVAQRCINICLERGGLNCEEMCEFALRLCYRNCDPSC